VSTPALIYDEQSAPPLQRVALPPVLMAAPVAYTRSLRNIAQALHEAGALRALCTSGAANTAFRVARSLSIRRRGMSPDAPPSLQARIIEGVPDSLIHNQVGWEVARQIVARVRPHPVALDWLWLRAIHHLDRTSASMLRRDDIQAYVGLEHASLLALRAASSLNKRTVLVCASPHSDARRRWVDPEYEAFPELKTQTTPTLLARQRVADARRDAELALADIVLTNSRLTTESLVSAGVASEKIVTLPLGIVGALSSLDERMPDNGTVTFLFAGTVAPHKGVHHLMNAWGRVGRSPAELHLYGKLLMPPSSLEPRPGLVVHGAVPYRELERAYLSASVLVLPTLYDGFGEVIGEALAHGVPVITTPRAGAADLIEHGRNGFIVPPGDPDALAACMESCVRHRRQLAGMRQEALETARRWSWPEYRKRLLQLLAERLH